MLVVSGVVDKDTDFLGANLASAVSEHKQHGVDDIGLSTAIGANYRCKTLCVCVCVWCVCGVCVCVVCVCE